MKKLVAEFIGTLWLVLGGCGSAVLAAGFPELGIGFVGVSFAFGLTVLTMAYAIGHVSGCHLNPAVSVGLWIGGRFDIKELLPYIGAQVLGGIAGAAILYQIASGQPGFELGGFAANGYGEHSPGGYSMMAALLCEVVMTFMFLIVILGATHSKAPAGVGHWSRPYPDSPDQHTGYQHFGKPGQKYEPGNICRRLGHGTIVAFLGGTHCWRHFGRIGLQVSFS